MKSNKRWPLLKSSSENDDNYFKMSNKTSHFRHFKSETTNLGAAERKEINKKWLARRCRVRVHPRLEPSIHTSKTTYKVNRNTDVRMR